MTDRTDGLDLGVIELSPPLLNCNYQEFRDPAALHHAFTVMAQAQDFISLVPDHACVHRAGYQNVSNTLLMGSAATPFIMRMAETPCLHLIAPQTGFFEQRTIQISVRVPGGGALIAPISAGEFMAAGAGCAIKIQPEAIARAAAAISGHTAGVSRRRRQRFERFNPVALQSGHALAQGVHALIRHIDDCFSVGPLVAARLGLDDVLHRSAAALLEPELLTEEPADLLRHRERSGKDAFDELIDYIRANLAQPLRMSDLEARSHYSRRALQYTFRDRLGCSPKQWIREQRLTLALEQLQAEGKRPSIRGVALACGYLDPSHFCSDFKRRYGMTPLQATRR